MPRIHPVIDSISAILPVRSGPSRGLAWHGLASAGQVTPSRTPPAAPGLPVDRGQARRHTFTRARARCNTRAVPLSIVVLQALESSPRADAILDRLQAHLVPAQRQSFRGSAAARLPCSLLPEEARAEIEQRLDWIDRQWRDCLAIRVPAAMRPGRFTRPRAPRRLHTDR